jgi:hypothetical protein
MEISTGMDCYSTITGLWFQLAALCSCVATVGE